MKDFIVAIDGPAGSGKSTISKIVAKKKGFTYLDTGAMYRMVTLATIKKNVNVENKEEIVDLLKNIKLNIEKDKFSKSANYSNTFLSKDRFTYQSKPSMSQDKGDGERLIENQKHGVKLHIFMRKFVQVDKKTQDFIYLGVANSVKYEGNKPIKLELKLQISLEDKLFEEFTKII